MADGYDHFDKNLEYHEGGGGSFVMGLLTGTVLGAGLGMLFAPRPGSELRTRISEQASTLANEGYRRASESASQLADRGREVYNRASEAVAKGADEAKRYASEASRQGPGVSGSSYGTESTYGGRPETIRGSSTE